MPSIQQYLFGLRDHLNANEQQYHSYTKLRKSDNRLHSSPDWRTFTLNGLYYCDFHPQKKHVGSLYSIQTKILCMACVLHFDAEWKMCAVRTIQLIHHVPLILPDAVHLHRSNVGIHSASTHQSHISTFEKKGRLYTVANIFCLSWGRSFILLVFQLFSGGFLRVYSIGSRL